MDKSKYSNHNCKKCSKNTLHRLVTATRGSYYVCVDCDREVKTRHRKKHWCRYLAQKANARKVPNSEIITETLVESIGYEQRLRCALTGECFDIESKWWKPSLDRIDSSKGYTSDNIRLVAWIVNHCRGELSDSEFIDMCKKVSSKN